MTMGYCSTWVALLFTAVNVLTSTVMFVLFHYTMLEYRPWYHRRVLGLAGALLLGICMTSIAAKDDPGLHRVESDAGNYLLAVVTWFLPMTTMACVALLEAGLGHDSCVELSLMRDCRHQGFQPVIIEPRRMDISFWVWRAPHVCVRSSQLIVFLLSFKNMLEGFDLGAKGELGCPFRGLRISDDRSTACSYQSRPWNFVAVLHLSTASSVAVPVILYSSRLKIWYAFIVSSLFSFVTPLSYLAGERLGRIVCRDCVAVADAMYVGFLLGLTLFAVLGPNVRLSDPDCAGIVSVCSALVTLYLCSSYYIEDVYYMFFASDLSYQGYEAHRCSMDSYG